MQGDALHFWLWVFTVATAVAGGALSVWGARVQRREAARKVVHGRGYRMVMASYVFMSVSIAAFVVRGFL